MQSHVVSNRALLTALFGIIGVLIVGLGALSQRAWLIGLGICFFAGPVVLGVLGQIETGRAQLRSTPSFDRDRQPVDYAITIGLQCLGAVGLVVIGLVIALGIVPGVWPKQPTKNSAHSPQVDGLLVPVPAKAASSK